MFIIFRFENTLEIIACARRHSKLGKRRELKIKKLKIVETFSLLVV